MTMIFCAASTRHPACIKFCYYFAAAALGFLTCICCIIIKKKCSPSRRARRRRRRQQQRRSVSNPDEHHHGAGPESTASRSSRGGLASAVIRCMPSFQYKETITDECGRVIAECAICLFEFRNGEYLRRLPNCGHVFHVSCSDTWLRMNSTCPLCRTSVLYDAEESVSMMAQLDRERPLGYRAGSFDGETTHVPELGLIEATTGSNLVLSMHSTIYSPHTPSIRRIEPSEVCPLSVSFTQKKKGEEEKPRSRLLFREDPTQYR